ncbi:MAG: serine--tRNA ligase [Oscillospiraceae bacterium]|jgi:seryl-tRNA synthetase|nr:serine--tRNA ligase [Oscillospiraceae bacterium]
MLDIRRIRHNPQELEQAMARRRKQADVAGLLTLDTQRRAILTEVEQYKNQRNEQSKRVAQLRRAGEDAVGIMAETKALGDRIAALDAQVAALDAQTDAILLNIPNIVSADVPDGADDKDNVQQRRWGEPCAFAWQPKAHWDIGTDLGVLDFEAAAKVTGARFVFYRGLGARLERAVINFFMDTHAANGYTEVLPPYMVNRAAMVGTGQLPKFEEDAFRVPSMDYFLIPTAEVPVTNMYRESILEGDALPIRHCAYSACFRAEAGAAGRDTRGLIRMHQFNKVEMVKITRPEQSYAELERMTEDAERVLRLLGLPHRVVLLCTGDTGFSSAKTYDIEVWMPSYGRYVEISSCSNCEDFQARRAGIRYRETPKDKPQFAHTLNGSGVAVGRTVAAILENYQNEDGSVTVPEALVPYMGGVSRIRRP